MPETPDDPTSEVPVDAPAGQGTSAGVIRFSRLSPVCATSATDAAAMSAAALNRSVCDVLTFNLLPNFEL
jgi:hypothetical protein